MKNGQDIIDKLGGPVALAEAMGVDPVTVRMWRYRKRFPARYWMRLLEFATGKNLAVTAEEIETFGGQADG